MTGIACIGGGRMGAALVAGWVAAGFAPEAIVVADPDPEARARHEAAYGVRTVATPADAVADADVVVLAVKPALVPEVLASTQPALRPGACVVSIAAGVRLAALEALVPEHPVVRAMPNTPALVAMAATAIAGGARAGEAELALAESVLGAVGVVVRVPEALLDAVTGLSGSGPAYVFLLAEALVAAGVANGLDAATAAVLVEQTLRGSAELLAQSDDAPAALRAMVTSPGGTTEAGLAVLEERGFPDAVISAVTRATERAQELGSS